MATYKIKKNDVELKKTITAETAVEAAEKYETAHMKLNLKMYDADTCGEEWAKYYDEWNDNFLLFFK